MTQPMLRDVVADDLPILFEHQRDPLAVSMAAFTVDDPDDAAAFEARWATILADRSIVKKTIVLDGHVVGHVSIYGPPGEREVTYWLARAYWARGIATAALRRMLADVKERPLHARAAKDNLASVRVLHTCGFAITRSEISYANARRAAIEEVLLTLKQ